MAGKISAENGKKGGRPLGKRNKKTIEKELEVEYLLRRVAAAKEAIVNAQILIATGTSYLYKIEKTKIIGPKGGISYRPERPKLVTNQLEIEDYLAGLIEEGDKDDQNDPAATYYYITTEKPENEAIKNLFDRAWGKPKESLDINARHTFSLRDLGKKVPKL